MKKLLIIIASIGLLCACNVQNSSVNERIIEQYVEAVETNDYSTMEELLAENYMGYGPSYRDSTDKKAALENWKYNIEQLYESISFERSQIVAVTIPSGPNQGEWVANWAEVRITYKDGRGSIIIWANSNYKIDNGKILKSYTFYNEADALRQLGIDLN
jgi:hypothetical protein